MNGDVHIVFQDGKWQVKIEGRDGESQSSDATQDEAVTAGRRAARAAKRELIVHGADGAIRERDSYGNDPPSRPG